jgi:shikimate dehydrogenase
MLPLEAVDESDLAALVEGLSLCGLAVTRPFKEIAASRCRSLGPEARRCGSVNTVKVDRDRWHGESTDGPGLLDALEELSLPERPRVDLLGAGGAAASVAASLVEGGAEVAVAARRPEAASALARRVGAEVRPWEKAGGEGIHLLINATPVGQDDPDESPVAPERLAGVGAVVDLVYGPRPTRLVREARRAGAQARDGLAMLVRQAERQYVLLHGERAPEGAMLRAARTALDRRARRLAGPARGG